jgi:hypothetical protein
MRSADGQELVTHDNTPSVSGGVYERRITLRD